MSKNLKESMRITSQEMKTINKDRNYRLTEMIQYEEQKKKKKNYGEVGKAEGKLLNNSPLRGRHKVLLQIG